MKTLLCLAIMMTGMTVQAQNFMKRVSAKQKGEEFIADTAQVKIVDEAGWGVTCHRAFLGSTSLTYEPGTGSLVHSTIGSNNEIKKSSLTITDSFSNKLKSLWYRIVDTEFKSNPLITDCNILIFFANGKEIFISGAIDNHSKESKVALFVTKLESAILGQDYEKLPEIEKEIDEIERMLAEEEPE